MKPLSKTQAIIWAKEVVTDYDIYLGKRPPLTKAEQKARKRSAEARYRAQQRDNARPVRGGEAQ